MRRAQRGMSCPARLTAENGLDYAIGGMQRDNYRVLPLNLKQDPAVPDDAALVIIAGPKKDLDLDELTALDAYMKSGGRLVALYDPATPDNFNRLISQWGVFATKDFDTGKPLSIADAVSNVAGEELTPLLQRANVQYSTSTSPATPGIPIADQIDVTFFPEAAAIDMLAPAQEMPPSVRILPIAMTTPRELVGIERGRCELRRGRRASGPLPRCGGRRSERDRAAGHNRKRYRSAASPDDQVRGVRRLGFRQEQVLRFERQRRPLPELGQLAGGRL